MADLGLVDASERFCGLGREGSCGASSTGLPGGLLKGEGSSVIFFGVG